MHSHAEHGHDQWHSLTPMTQTTRRRRNRSGVSRSQIGARRDNGSARDTSATTYSAKQTHPGNLTVFLALVNNPHVDMNNAAIIGPITKPLSPNTAIPPSVA